MPADKLHITLAGREHVVEEARRPACAGRPRAEATRSPPGSMATVRDLAAPLADGDRVEPVGLTPLTA